MGLVRIFIDLPSGLEAWVEIDPDSPETATVETENGKRKKTVEVITLKEFRERFPNVSKLLSFLLPS